MTLYTGKVIADWLGLTERRVRQLRDKEVLVEVRPGFYGLKESVRRYIRYLGGAGKENLNEERALLTKAKREAAEMENKRLQGELLEAGEIEKGLRTMNLNIRSRFLSIPAKLAPALVAASGDQAVMYNLLKRAICETLEELTDYRSLLEEKNEDEETENEDH